jgi:dihydrofolate reductase
MRKVKLQIQVSLDGFVAGPNGEQDWTVWKWDEILNTYVGDLTDSSDSFFVGRVTYEAMAAYFPALAANPESKPEDLAFAHRMNTTRKIVFSRTLSTVDWSNSRLAQGSVEEEVARLKQQPGKDLLIYGGAGIVSSFILHNLIDEYHLFINPVVLGNGMPIWKEIRDRLQMKLINTTVSSTGIVVLHYQQEK